MNSPHSAPAPAPAVAGPAVEPGSAAACSLALRTARRRTLALLDGLAHDAMLGPMLAIVNPPLWEFGHLAWFQERWLLRARPDGTLAPSMLPGADALYDSSAVAHATRWTLPLPTLDVTRAYLAQVLERALERVDRMGDRAAGDLDATDLAFHATVCAQHEQMHAEAFACSGQALGYPALRRMGTDAGSAGIACDGHATSEVAQPPMRGTPGSGLSAGDAWIAGGDFMLGAHPGAHFVFDNEKWAHPVTVAPFSIARHATTCAEFAEFVDAGGYLDPRWWSAAGLAWRGAACAVAPVYWRPMLARQGWEVRCNDTWRALRPEEPMLHVNAHEAEAWCRWAGRRLPSEAEWEFAAATAGSGAPGLKRRHPWGDAAPALALANLWHPAAGMDRVAAVDAFAHGDSLHGCRQMTGNVWEWTASVFEGYPGFRPDPYREYSQPWFGTHRVLRGGSFATDASMIRNTWRNFFTPDRRDVYAGFRTCAVDER
jgi:iron(II)-dependent oxidoreductase